MSIFVPLWVLLSVLHNIVQGGLLHCDPQGHCCQGRSAAVLLWLLGLAPAGPLLPDLCAAPVSGLGACRPKAGHATWVLLHL